MAQEKLSNLKLDLSDYGQGQATISPDYYNENLIPVPKAMKNWNWINYSTIWAGMSHNVVAFELAGLLTFQYGAPLALFIIGFAYGTLLIALYLNGHIGAKWGIPYPVAVRPMFGLKGSSLPVIMRAAVALFWFAVQTYVGGTLIDAVISVFYPSWESLTANILGMPAHLAISFFIFWFLNVIVLFRGMNEVKNFELIAGPLIVVTLGGLFAYGIERAHGLGPLFTVTGSATPAEIGLSIASMAGVWATLVLNIPDFTRFSKSQKDQLIGQAIGLPIVVTLFSFIAVGITSTMSYIYHIPSSEALKYVNPVNIMYLFTGNQFLVLITGLSLVIATVSVNVAANIVSPVYDLIALFPRKLKTWSVSAIVAAIVALFYVPQLWYNNASTIFNLLNIIGAGLGAIAGIMIADYWIMRKTNLSLVDLFMPRGQYWYSEGINWKAILVLAVAFGIPIIGFAIPSLSPLYDYGWYLSVAVSLLLYLALNKVKKY